MVCISVLIDFNSIKVRLEPRTFHLASKRPAYFNSIKVRLELCTPKRKAFLVRFQFHKGAIRTFRETLYLQILTRFQFHKGAIRTVIVVVLVDEDHDFNSIKVRLERKHLRDTHYHENFNSIKVRLELMAIGLGAALELFQFHKGAIRTNVIGVAAMRLYEFQFHKGAIRTSA